MTVAVEIDLLSPQVFGLIKAFSLKIYCQSEGKYCSCITNSLTIAVTVLSALCVWKRRRSRTVSWQSTSIQMVSLFAVYSFIPLATFSIFYYFLYLSLSRFLCSSQRLSSLPHCHRWSTSLSLYGSNNLFLFQSLNSLLHDVHFTVECYKKY